MESDTVLRARVIAQQRLGSVAPRWAHVRGVAAATELMATGLATIDAEAVVAAAWLHDVGYAPSVRRSTGFHPVDGALFARAEGFPDVVVSLVAYHTGAVFGWRDLAEPEVQGLRNLRSLDQDRDPDGSGQCQ